MDDIKLPSGSILKIQVAPFSDSKALYQAVLKELKGISADSDKQIDTNFIKDIICSVLSSDAVEKALEKCMSRCLYDSARITNDLFEQVEKRQDYLVVVQEVAWANVMPFMSGLSQLLKQSMQKISSIQA